MDLFQGTQNRDRTVIKNEKDQNSSDDEDKTGDKITMELYLRYGIIRLLWSVILYLAVILLLFRLKY